MDTGRRLIPGPDHFGALLFFLLVAFLLSGRSDDVWPTVAGASADLLALGTGSRRRGSAGTAAGSSCWPCSG